MDTKIDIDQITFSSKWNVWYHFQKNNWKLDSYKKIFEISNIVDFWNFSNNLDLIGGLNSQHFFMMRNYITPLWEDKLNKQGGCWSIKISIDKSYELWVKLSMYIVGETLTNENSLINGLSICTKNTTTSVIKIWIKDNNYNSIKNLPREILNEFGFNIIYKSHVPEY